MGVATSHMSDDENVSETVSPLKPQSLVPDDVKKYVEECISILKLELLDNQRSSNSTKLELEKIKMEYQDLKARHSKLAEEYNELLKTGVRDQTTTSEVSDMAIDEWIDDFFAKPTVQHGYFTEKIEAAVLRRAIKVILKAMAESADTAQLHFANHSYTGIIRPIKKPVCIKTGNVLLGSLIDEKALPLIDENTLPSVETELIKEMLAPEKEKDEVLNLE